MMDEEWLSKLFDENYLLLYRIGNVFLNKSNHQDVIEEQIQETFLLAWQKRNKVMRHPNPSGWLVETFRHCLQHACRKELRELRHRVYSIDESTMPEVCDDGPSMDQLIQFHEQCQLLHRLLGDRDANIFIRYCLQNERAEDIGLDHHISAAAVRMCVSRVRKKLITEKGLFLCLAVLLAA